MLDSKRYTNLAKRLFDLTVAVPSVIILSPVLVFEKKVLGQIKGISFKIKDQIISRAKTQRRKEKRVIMTENEIGKIVVDAAIAVHRALGPGLLETVYEIVLAHELSRRGLRVGRQVPVSIEYDGIRFDEGFRTDLPSPSRPQAGISPQFRGSPNETWHHQSRKPSGGIIFASWRLGARMIRGDFPRYI